MQSMHNNIWGADKAELEVCTFSSGLSISRACFRCREPSETTRSDSARSCLFVEWTRERGARAVWERVATCADWRCRIYCCVETDGRPPFYLVKKASGFSILMIMFTQAPTVTLVLKGQLPVHRCHRQQEARSRLRPSRRWVWRPSTRHRCRIRRRHLSRLMPREYRRRWMPARVARPESSK